MADSKQTYINKYKINYGTIYPEGHIIRLYEHLLKYEFDISGKNNESLLDFGCGNGTHTEYFKSKGFTTFGVDIIPGAIKQAKNRYPDNTDNFAVMELYQDTTELFDQTYDVILCNQVLYYMNNTKLKIVTEQLYNQLRPGGLFYVTMMGTKNHYWNKSVPAEDGLNEVTLSGRLNETSLINFVHNEEDLANRFSLFEPVYSGYYDSSSRDGSTYHYQFLGKKK